MESFTKNETFDKKDFLPHFIIGPSTMGIQAVTLFLGFDAGTCSYGFIFWVGACARTHRPREAALCCGKVDAKYTQRDHLFTMLRHATRKHSLEHGYLTADIAIRFLRVKVFTKQVMQKRLAALDMDHEIQTPKECSCWFL